LGTETKAALRCLPMFSGRDWSTQLIQALRQILCRALRDFPPKRERRLIDVNRDSYVLRVELVIAVFIQVPKELSLSETDRDIARWIYLRVTHFGFQQTDSVQGIDRGPLPSHGGSVSVCLVFSLLPTSCMNSPFSFETVQRVL